MMDSRTYQAIQEANPLDVDCPRCGTTKGESCHSTPVSAFYCIDRTKKAIKREWRRSNA